MRDLTTEEHEAAIRDACKLLRPLTKPVRSRAVVHWNDPVPSKDPRDVFEAAVEFVIALLDPAIPTGSAQAEKTYDTRARQAADELLGIHASLVRRTLHSGLGVRQSGKGRAVSSFGIAGLPPWSRPSANGMTLTRIAILRVNTHTQRPFGRCRST
jgi:hypothetical protein